MRNKKRLKPKQYIQIEEDKTFVNMENGLIKFKIKGALYPSNLTKYLKDEVLDWIAHALGKSDWEKASNSITEWVSNNCVNLPTGSDFDKEDDNDNDNDDEILLHSKRFKRKSDCDCDCD